VTVLFALTGALFYGLSDFVGGVASRRTSAWSVALLASVGGGLLILGCSLFVDGDPETSDLLWGVLAGLGNGLGTAFLYRGLAGGRMGVVAPISAVGAAVVPVAVALATGERPGLWVWAGILAALPGVWMVASEPADDPEGAAGATAGAGVVDGVLAGLGFGVLFAALGQVPASAGLLPLAVNQLASAVVIVTAAVLVRAAWLPRERPALLGLGCGVLGACAVLAFLAATHRGSLTVSAVLASLYPAFTILLAATVLKEHVHRTQALGLALCGVAVALIAAG
jgi:drug/metabolite transporter (DMT)-like permease